MKKYYVAENNKDGHNLILNKDNRFNTIEQAEAFILHKYKTGFKKKLVIFSVEKEYEASPLKVFVKIHSETNSIAIKDTEQVLFRFGYIVLRHLSNEKFAEYIKVFNENQDIVSITYVESPVIKYKLTSIESKIKDLEKEKNKIIKNHKNFLDTFGIDINEEN